MGSVGSQTAEQQGFVIVLNLKLFPLTFAFGLILNKLVYLQLIEFDMKATAHHLQPEPWLLLGLLTFSQMSGLTQLSRFFGGCKSAFQVHLGQPAIANLHE